MTVSMSEPSFKFCGPDRAARLRTLRDKIAPILANRVHRHFTDHSVSHSDRVVQLVETLSDALPEDKRLREDEAFILYAACYTHDVGMHNERAGEHGRLATALAESGTAWSELSDERRLDLIRQRHHEVSADMIIASRRFDRTGYTLPPIGLALDDSDYAGEIAAVAESHVVDTESARYAELVGTQSGSRRLRLLSALLRLSDILDEAQHRALRSQAETLDLNVESLMHWWRHYYTREVFLDIQRNIITIYFEFPQDRGDEYEGIIPELQMPWVRREVDRHREVFAENRLVWHVNSVVRRGAFATLDPMPERVMVRMLQTVAKQKAEDASSSKKTLLDYQEQARSFGNQQIENLHAAREECDTNEYLQAMVRAATDLHETGGTLSAISRLQSAIHFSTKNGRSADTRIHVGAAITLGRLLLERRDNRTAARAFGDATAAAVSLPDSDEIKASFYRWLAKANFMAGSFPGGREAAANALRLLPEGADRDDLQADLQEATMLEGLDPEETADA